MPCTGHQRSIVCDITLLQNPTYEPTATFFPMLLQYLRAIVVFSDSRMQVQNLPAAISLLGGELGWEYQLVNFAMH